MLKKKGFTLIELLAVIVILGLLIVIITPTVTDLIADSKSAVEKEQINTIINATKKYMLEHTELLPDMTNDSKKVVYIDELIDNGVLDNTKKTIPGCVLVTYSSSYNQYEYEYKKDDSAC